MSFYYVVMLSLGLINGEIGWIRVRLLWLLLQLTKSKHTCGICKKISNHLDRQTWVRIQKLKVL